MLDGDTCLRRET